MRIVVSPLATLDLQSIYDFLVARSPSAADRLLVEIGEAFGLLASGLRVGRAVTLRTGRRVWSWPVPPYRIYFRLLPDEMQVVRIYHQARKPIERRPRG